MGIIFNPNRNIGLIPVQFNTPRIVRFGNANNSDSFQNSSVDKYFDINTINLLVNKNPKIKYILKSNKIPLNLNLNINEIQNNHCRQTSEIASKIAQNIPNSLKYSVNIKDLKDAAMLHDIGKVFIPSEILNKPSCLTPEEYKIMSLHSDLGYELLKNTDLNEHVLNLIKYHHNITDAPNGDINFDILNLADKYCALTEQRVYKPAMTHNQALTVLLKEVKSGIIDQRIFNALVNSGIGEQEKNKVNIS